MQYLVLTQTPESVQMLDGEIIKISVMNPLNNNGTLSLTIENSISTINFENLLVGENAIICFYNSSGNNGPNIQQKEMPVESDIVLNNAFGFEPP